MILTNSLHRTSVQLNLRGQRVISPYQAKRARKVLCGIPTCNCGGILSERGPQYLDGKLVEFEPRTDGSGVISE